MNSFAINETTDQELLAKFFIAERELYAYLLGDLDPFFFINTRWWIAQKDQQSSSPIEAALLSYNAFSTPVIIGLAENDAQAALWETTLTNPPKRAHLHYRKIHQEIIKSAGDLQPIGTHYRMVWKANHKAGENNENGSAIIDLAEVVTLTTDVIEAIRELHQSSSPGAYFDERLLETGLCFGIYRGKQLVAFSGCHVYSQKYSVAALGAIVTHTTFRNQGLGAKVSLRALNELQNTIDCICLNVHRENSAAIKIYQRLGFVIYSEYEEAVLCN